MKVLIVNDEFFIICMLQQMVELVGISDIDTAKNGYDGFNLVKAK